MIKKLILLVSMILFLTLLPSITSAEKMSSEARSEFVPAAEEFLRNSVNYYNTNSAVTLDSLELIDADIIKIIKTDDPNTPENEEEIEEYTSHIVTVLMEYEIKRDSLFIFKKKEVLYYDLTNDEMLNSGNVFINDEVKDFFQKYLDDLHKHMTPFSLAIFMMLLSLVIVVPIFIMIVHNKGNGSSVHNYQNEQNIRG